MAAICLIVGLTLLLGGLAGAWGRRRSSRLVVHLLLGLAAFLATEFLCSLLVSVLMGMYTGRSAGLFTILMWFPKITLLVLPAAVLLTAVGQLAGALLAGRGAKPRTLA